MRVNVRMMTIAKEMITLFVCLPPEEEVLASKACVIQYLLFVCFVLSKATENESNREI